MNVGSAQIERGGKLIVNDLYRKAGFFVRCEGIEVAAEPVLFDGNV